MTLTGFKKRLEEAKENNSKVKLLFQYPSTSRAIKKSGSVLTIDDDSFTILEKFDGKCTYSYNFLVEVSDEEENKGGYNGQQHYRE